MFTFNSLVQKAQSLIDPSVLPFSRNTDGNPPKAALFRLQFRLPDSQTPLHEITAELSLSAPQSSKASAQALRDKSRPQERGNTYVGKLHLSESFLCFSTQPTSFHPSASTQASTAFTGQTQGAGPAGNGFALPLCAIRRVERLQTPNSLFALAITTWNGFTALSGRQGNSSDAQRFTVQLAGSRQASERFCDGLKKGLRDGVKEVENLKAVIGECYSEYLLSGATKAERETAMEANGMKEPPDAGLGMVFRYPGNAKKLREQSKIRLWREYLRGRLGIPRIEARLMGRQTMAEMPPSSDNLHSINSSESACQIGFVERCGSLLQALYTYGFKSQGNSRTHSQSSQERNHWLSTRSRKT